MCCVMRRMHDFRYCIFKWVVVCCSFTEGFTCQGQQKNSSAENFISYAQQKNVPSGFPEVHEENVLIRIHKVDSIADAGQIASYFARLYSTSMESVELKLVDADSNTRAFIRKFELNFIQYFLSACYGYQNGNLSKASPWSCYFSHPNARPLQFMLMGANAHINGDVWQAMVSGFSEQEIKRYKKKYLSFQTALAKAYSPLFDSVEEKNSYLRFMNSFTKGFAKIYGERVLSRWRKRNVNLALLYYSDPAKFKRKLAVLNRKKRKIDSLILRMRV
jgi:hypothetical protein